MHKATCLFPADVCSIAISFICFRPFFFDYFYKILTLQKELQDLDYKICNTEFETSDQNVLAVEYEAAKEELNKTTEGRRLCFYQK